MRRLVSLPGGGCLFDLGDAEGKREVAKQPDPEIDAFDADCRAKLEAFWNALPPEER